MRKILFIINPKAGKTEFDIRKEDIEETFRQAGRLSEIEVINTDHKNQSKALVDKLYNSNFDEKIMIMCGGDGSLNELVNNSYGKNISIGLIPMGTGNDFAKNFDYSNFNVKKLLDFDIRPIDLIRVNDFYSLNVTSIGFDTQVLQKAYEYLEKKPSLGKKSYIKATIASLTNLNYENLSFNLKLLDGSDIEIDGEYLISAICNGGYYGSGFNPAPDAKIDDGYLNLILAEKIPFLKLPSMILKYKKGQHQSSKYLSEFKVKKGVISSKNEFLANADGEIFKTNKINFEILPNALNWVYFK